MTYSETRIGIVARSADSLAVAGLMVLGMLLLVRPQIAHAQALPYATEKAQQFDFWVGQWEVNNRFFRNGDWVEGGMAEARIYSVLRGKAVLEFWDGTFANGYRMLGFSLRYYDPNTAQWHLALNWPPPDRPGFSELQGTFRHNRGQFYSRRPDTTGAEILTRYTFSDITPVSLRWDNGTSRDGGETWQGSWIMEFSRSAETAPWTGPEVPFHTLADGDRCSHPEARAYDDLQGDWHGTLSTPASSEVATEMEVRRVLGGCAVLMRTRYSQGPVREELLMGSFLPDVGAWRFLRLDDRAGSGYDYLDATEVSTLEGETWRIHWQTRGPDQFAYEAGMRDGTAWQSFGTVRLQRISP